MLSNANKRWHARLDSGYQSLLENLTALELERAGALCQAFQHDLISHIAFERAHIEPLTKKWENNTLKLIQSDHLILERLLPKLEQAISEIKAAQQPRSVLVKKLDIFIKMRNVLEHHDLREMEVLYPLLDQQLDRKLCAKLAKEMDDASEAL